MGGLWVDYDLESTLPGLFVLGEANFSDHGANRLGASALMQGLADGFFIVPYTIAGHFAGRSLPNVSADSAEFVESEGRVRERTERILGVRGRRTADSFHRQLGRVLWDRCGMARNAQGLGRAKEEIRALRAEFWEDLRVPADGERLNQNLEHAGRVADFLEFAELLVDDATHRNESCGGHFREEFQTPDGEARRDDQNFSYVAAWEFRGDDQAAALHREPLSFEYVRPSQRSYK
jgi:succinate dehydrogenase / fumarate reductase flavoprotein subunit